MTLLCENRALLDGFRAGDREALAQIYWHYIDVVETAIRRGVRFDGGKSVAGVPEDRVADLVQDTFMRAFAERTRQSYDGLRPFKPLLLTIARNLVVDWARANGRTLGDSERLLETMAAPPCELPELHEAWAEPSTVALVKRYVQSLTPPLFDLYQQRYVHGRSQAEAATCLGVGRQTIRTLEGRLRDGLRKLLAIHDR